MMQKRIKVLVGMSGGVDSSVAVLLLKQKGYEVVGGFMKNWSNQICDEQATCSWRTERQDALRVAGHLEISLHAFDFEDAYREDVYGYMLREYKAGRTPNPDVLCNKYMKFGLFLQKARELDCDFVATGHYARVKHAKHVSRLYAGHDLQKDQSYFLSRLHQDQLRHAIFPLGSMKKSRVRAVARKHKLPVAEKPDSQGICFVGEVALRDHLIHELKPQQGNIVDTNGRILGTHQGQQFFTIGQRHGLHLPGKEPYFVLERRVKTNEVVVAHENDPALYTHEVHVRDVTSIVPEYVQKQVGNTLMARLRYRQPLQKCRIEHMEAGNALVHFEKPQRAVAPGQFLVWYKRGEVLGSGIVA